MTTSLFHHGEVGGTAFRSLLKYLHNALATDGACGGPLPGVAQLYYSTTTTDEMVTSARPVTPSSRA